MKVTIWTGPAWEPWGPASVFEGGIGGSETAAVYMARHLASLGCEVAMYGQHEGHEGTHDGVVYRPYTDLAAVDDDVFISSRDKHVARVIPINARHKVLWCHDVNAGDDWQNDLKLFDEVYALSEWHRTHMIGFHPNLSPRKIWVTRNGIDLSLFSGPQPEKEHRFTFSSSPDRGLDVLLDFWPDIRRVLPDAELHIYYGFENWKKMAKGQIQNLKLAFVVSRIQDLAAEGVCYHGRVGQRELSESHRRSLMWLYPTAFRETSCITAMEAQAAGAVPIATNLAALTETVQHGVLVNPPNTRPHYKTEFLAAFEKLVRSESALGCLAEVGRAWALANMGWEGVARSWIARWRDTWGVS